MTELIIRGVRKAYGGTLTLKRGDLDIKSGEVHVLIGSNGSGKSTLCKIVAGSVRLDEGFHTQRPAGHRFGSTRRTRF